MRIAISGASGIGKTRLASLLARMLHVPLIPDVIDNVLHEHGYRHWGECPTPNEERDIRLQALRRKIKLENESKAWVSDKSAVDYFAYWLTLAGSSATAKQKAIFERLVRKHVRNYDRVILPLFGKYPVEHRARRNTNPQHRLRIHRKILGLFEALHVPCESYDFKFRDSDAKVVQELGLARSEKKRIGLYLGTFDPFHEGHAWVVRQALRYCDEVLIQPHPNVSHGKQHTSLKHRAAMIRLAMSKDPRVRVNLSTARIRADRYREDSVQQVAEKFPDREIVVVMGTDKLAHPAYKAGPLLRRFHIVLQRGKLTSSQAIALHRMKAKIVVRGAPVISASRIRLAGTRATYKRGIDPVVAKYIKRNRLYEHFS